MQNTVGFQLEIETSYRTLLKILICSLHCLLML